MMRAKTEKGQLGAVSWLDALADRWERRAADWELMPHYAHYTGKEIAGEIRKAVEQLRAEAEKSISLAAPHEFRS